MLYIEENSVQVLSAETNGEKRPIRNSQKYLSNHVKFLSEN